MRVSSEERHKGTGLVPSDKHFRARVAKEAADVGCAWDLEAVAVDAHWISDSPPQKVIPQILSESSMDVSPAM